MIRLLESKDAKDYQYIVLQTARETEFLSRVADETNESLTEIQYQVDYLVKSDSYFVFVAEVEGKVVGLCSIHEVSKRIKVRHRMELGIKILKNYQGLGLGRQLIATAIRFAQEKGYEMIALSAMKDNKVAIHLYETFGFKQYGELEKAYKLPDGRYQDEIFMVKMLDK